MLKFFCVVGFIAIAITVIAAVIRKINSERQKKIEKLIKMGAIKQIPLDPNSIKPYIPPTPRYSEKSF
jgi:hypothetical protein